MAVEFIECTSVKISYDVMGRATVSYTIVADSSGMKAYPNVSFGNKTYDGYVVSVTTNQIPKTSWYESYVTIISTAS